MAIKIQGSTIIDDDKNIKENTGFHSDPTNSALRPRSSSGGSYMQRWTGSTWETIFFAGNGGVNCYRDFTVSSPYKYYGDGSGLTNLPAPTFPYNYYYDTNNTAVRASGTVYIQNSNGTATMASFNNNTSPKVNLTSTGITGTLSVSDAVGISDTLTCDKVQITRSGINITIGGENSIELTGGSYQFIDFGGNDYQGRIIQEGANMSLTARNNLIFGPDNNIIVRGVDATDAEVRVMRLNSNNVVKKANIGSSRRYKSNIINLTTESFDKIYNITPVSFNYNEDCVEGKDLTGKGNYLKMGVIAEDIEQFMPEVVQYGYFSDQYIDIDGKKVLKEDPVETPMSVNYESIFICAVGALQELRQRVIDLEEELQTLKASLQTP
jgi:hypothetical protein